MLISFIYFLKMKLKDIIKIHYDEVEFTMDLYKL